MLNIKTTGYLLIAFSAVLFIILTFVKIEYDKQAAFICKTFDKNDLNMEKCPAHENNASWLFTAAFGITFLAFGFGLYMLLLPKISAETMKKEFKQIDTSKLDEEEKKVYDFIKNRGGSSYQTDLIKETESSKVKITRVLDKLESKGILERKRRGMTNIIVLK